MISKLIRMFFLLFSVVSCTKPSPPHIVEARRIINEFTKERARSGLIPFGLGGAFFEEINEFNLDFKYVANSMTIDQARVIIVENTEALLSKVNHDKKVIPYLKYYPYNEKHLYFSIGFQDSSNKRLVQDNISLVKVSHGNVIYSNLINIGYKNKFEEPYSEAYEKVYGRPLPDRNEQLDPLNAILRANRAPQN